MCQSQIVNDPSLVECLKSFSGDTLNAMLARGIGLDHVPDFCGDYNMIHAHEKRTGWHGPLAWLYVHKNIRGHIIHLSEGPRGLAIWCLEQMLVTAE